MPELDTVIRNAVVVTAADVFTSDIAIAGGVVAALGRDLGPARRDIDAAGRYVLPGGIDAHCHFDQPMRGSVTLADDFLSGPISAAHGGTTTVVPFACQREGQSVRAAVEDYHRRAAGKPVIDYAFHLIVSDPTEDVLRRELPALIAEGYSSFKIYTKIPNGVPGVETRLPILFSEGVNQGRIDLGTFVALTATNPAKLYGLYPRKGSIAVGADADLVIWDKDREVVIDNDMLHHNCDYTPYAGLRVRGWPAVVLSRGEIVVEEGKLLAQPGQGRFLRCDRPAPARVVPPPAVISR